MEGKYSKWRVLRIFQEPVVESCVLRIIEKTTRGGPEN